MGDKDKIQQAFGRVLYDLRSAKGYSQEKFALESGIDRSYVSRLELGKRAPTINMIFTISGFFEISASDFMARIEKQLGSPK